MDPNETLARIRRLIGAADVRPVALDEDTTTELCELVDALDRWLASGGFLPSRWNRSN